MFETEILKLFQVSWPMAGNLLTQAVSFSNFFLVNIHMHSSCIARLIGTAGIELDKASTQGINKNYFHKQNSVLCMRGNQNLDVTVAI